MIDGKTTHKETEKKSTDQIDRVAIRLKIYDFYRDNVLPTAKMILSESCE